MVSSDSTVIRNNKIINCICNNNTYNGILLESISGNVIQECTCNYNLYSQSSTLTFSQVDVQLTGAGIQFNASNNNSIEGCVCAYNASNCLSQIRGTDGVEGTEGGKAAVGGSSSVTGAGIYLASSNNNIITACVCDNNLIDNMSSGTGGDSYNSFPYGGGGAGVGGAGADSSQTGMAGFCSVIGGGIYLLQVITIP